MKATTTARAANVRITSTGANGLAPFDETVSVPPGDQFTVAASLAYRWYDEIESGKKRIEYRDMTEYWGTHLFKTVTDENGEDGDVPAVRIKFTRGYTKTNMTWTITRIDIDVPAQQYCIHLGKRVE